MMLIVMKMLYLYLEVYNFELCFSQNAIQIKCCGLNLQIDGTEDHVIHCFKEGEACASRKDKLKVATVRVIRGSRSDAK